MDSRYALVKNLGFSHFSQLEADSRYALVLQSLGFSPDIKTKNFSQLETDSRYALVFKPAQKSVDKQTHKRRSSALRFIGT